MLSLLLLFALSLPLFAQEDVDPPPEVLLLQGEELVPDPDSDFSPYVFPFPLKIASKYVDPLPAVSVPPLPTRETKIFERALLFFRQGKMDSARHFFERAAITGTVLWAYAKHFELLIRLEKRDRAGAIKVFKKLDSAKVSARLLLMGGLQLVRTFADTTDFDPEEIEKRIKKRFRKTKRLFEFDYRRAVYHDRKKNQEEALSGYLKILKRAPVGLLADSAFGKLSAKAVNWSHLDLDQRYTLANYLRLKRDFREAFRIITPLAKKKGPKQQRFMLLSAKTWYKKKDYKKALRGYKKVQKKFGSTPNLNLAVARCLKRLKRRAAADKIYMAFIEKYPKSKVCDDLLWTKARNYEEKRHFTKAIKHYRKIDKVYKKGKYASKSLWRMGYCYYKQKNIKKATAIWKKHGERYPRSSHTVNGYYWIGKSLAAEGELDSAVVWYLRTIKKNPLSWYAFWARKGLKDLKRDSLSASFSAARIAQPDSFLLRQKNHKTQFGKKVNPEIKLGFQRAMFFLKVGANDLARIEFSRVERGTRNDLVMIYRLARIYETHGLFREAYRLSRRLVWKISAEEFSKMPIPILKLLFPRYYGEAILLESRKYGVHPLFVHGLIKQESMYDHRIGSPAGALGLMQFIPPTARMEAKKLGMNFAPDSLYNPVYSIRLGAFHLNRLLTRFDENQVLTLCAYNAGPKAARRWHRQNKKLPLDAFVEEIGYTETRNYVKKCMRNFWVYQEIWGASGGAR